MHVQVSAPFDDGPLYLDAGITTVLSLGTRATDDDTKLQERARSRTPEFMGPTLYTIGRRITRGATPDEADLIVRESVDRGFDLVKVYGLVSPEAFTRLHDTAKRLGIKVTGHAQRALGMQPVYTQRQDLAHVEEYLYAAFNPPTRGYKAAAYSSAFVLFMMPVSVLMLIVVAVAVVLTLKVWSVWHTDAATIWKRASLLIVLGFAWTFVVGAGFLTPRIWRSGEAGLARIARDTAEAGIWVTPTLVVLDYVERQVEEEFYSLIQHPEMRYLRPGTRDRWINNNDYRVPAWAAPMQSAMWQSWTDLMSRLVGELHEANVPLLAGSDAVGPHGCSPAPACTRSWGLLVQAGLTPYEALRTATVHAATHLDTEQEFGRIATGLRADLILLAGNPLDRIDNISTRVGVMKRGRWFSADELETTLDQLAEERKYPRAIAARGYKASKEPPYFKARHPRWAPSAGPASSGAITAPVERPPLQRGSASPGRMGSCPRPREFRHGRGRNPRRLRVRLHPPDRRIPQSPGREWMHRFRRSARSPRRMRSQLRPECRASAPRRWRLEEDRETA